MENFDLTQLNSIPNEMQVNLNMFRALVLNWVGREIHRTDIVTKDDSGSARRMIQLMQQLAQPARFSDTICNCSVLSFRARSRHRGLPL
jgi:hypothetical protein